MRLAALLAIAFAIVANQVGAAEADEKRVVIVDLAATAASAEAVALLRSRLGDRDTSVASEPDIRGALEGVSAAEPPSDPLAEAGRELAAARSKFADFATAEAIAALSRGAQRAVVALPDRADEARAVLAEIHFLWGRIREADGKSDAAGHFRATARLDPDRKLDPGQFKPSLVKAFASAAKSAASGKGAIRATGSPKGATVEVDGKDVGTLPLSIDSLGDGVHYVVVRAAGYKAQAFAPETRGKVERLAIELEPMNRSEKLAAARARLQDDPQSRQALAIVLAASASQTAIVLRDEGGQVRAASFAGGQLSAWAAPAALTFQAAKTVAQTPTPAVTEPAPGASLTKSSSPWYTTWKGPVAGAAVVGVLAVAAILVFSGGETEFVIGGACSGADCP